MNSLEGWQTYSQTRYGFSLRYPPDFTHRNIPKPPGRGFLFLESFFESRFASGTPEGQVAVGVFERDADDLRAWIIKHSREPNTPDSDAYYFYDSFNLRDSNVMGHAAVSFDWGKGSESGTIHAVAFFASDRVLEFQWGSENDNYEPNIHRIFDLVVGSYKE